MREALHLTQSVDNERVLFRTKRDRHSGRRESPDPNEESMDRAYRDESYDDELWGQMWYMHPDLQDGVSETVGPLYKA